MHEGAWIWKALLLVYLINNIIFNPNWVFWEAKQMYVLFSV